MKLKFMKIKFGIKTTILGTLLLLLTGISFSNSIEFHDNILTYFGTDIQETYSEVQFNYGGNENVGMLFWLDPITVGETTVTMGTTSKTCTKQLRGFYYNNVRGTRLRPIDQDTLTTLKLANTEYNNLTLENGLYMNCNGEDAKSVYGQVKWTYDTDITTLNAGISYNFTENDPIWVFSPSLVFIEGIRIASGYIYDNLAGVAKIKDVAILETSCAFGNAYIANGASVTAYQSDVVPVGSTCQSQTRTCENGILNGTYEYAECEIGGSKSTPNNFYFNKITDAKTGTIYLSEGVIISGLSPDVTATGKISTGRWMINDSYGSGFTGLIRNGDVIRIELKSADEYEKVTYSKIEIGNYATTFYIKTQAESGDTEDDERNDNLISLFIRFINTFKYNSGSTLASLFQTAQGIIEDNLDIVDTSSSTGEIRSFKTLLELTMEAISGTAYNTGYQTHGSAYYASQSGTVFEENKHTTPNCKDYSIKYAQEKSGWYSPYMTAKKYFVDDISLRKYLDAMNPGDCRINTYIEEINHSSPDIDNDDAYIAPNGRVFFIKKYPQGYGSMEFTIIKYFKSETEVKSYIDKNNPETKIWDHTIDEKTAAVEFKADNGKIYKIYKTDKGYMSYQFMKVQYFGSLEAIQTYINDRNK